jgi:hypothetical protein
MKAAVKKGKEVAAEYPRLDRRIMKAAVVLWFMVCDVMRFLVRKE